MAEEKVEGEVQETSGGSSVAEGSSSSSYETQMESVEQQLKKAQATLFDLQYLKEKLELERRQNKERALEEQEIFAAKKIKEENERLRKELKGYQGEIDSLKDIIGILKDDLVETTDRLQHKVEDSLRLIGENPESKHTAHQVHNTRHVHPAAHAHHKVKKQEEPAARNFFADHLEPKGAPIHDQHEQVEKKADQIQGQIAASKAEVGDHSAEAIQAEISNSENSQIKHQETQQPAAAAQQGQSENSEAQNQADSSHESAPATVSAEHSSDPVSAQIEVQNSTGDAMASHSLDSNNALDQANISQNEVQEATNNLDDAELDEYEEIKRELEALEGEHLFKSEVDNEQNRDKIYSPHKAEDYRGKKHEHKQEHKKVKKPLLSFLKKKDKPQSDENQAVANAKPELVQQEIPKVSAASIPGQSSQQTESAPPITHSQAAPAATAVELEQDEGKPQQVAGEKKEDEAPKSLASLTSVFKKKKKRIREDNNEPKANSSAAGKMIVKAAVVVLVVLAGGIAYKISNAQKLKELYISRAQTNVSQTSDPSNRVPDGMSSDPPEIKYKEAFADAPFEETVWETYTDHDLGIKLEYPKNTSYRLKPVGSLNLWFLRRNGYLLQIEKVLTERTLREYSADLTSTIKYDVSSINIRNHDTLHLVLKDDLPVKGNIYLVKADGAIYKIWYKTYFPGESPDDEKRVQHMLDTLDFISSDS